MAPLPRKFDAQIHGISDLFHSGKRAEALRMLDSAIASGRAGDETKALAEYLRTAKRGRQPFGATHLWYEIGTANEGLRNGGSSYDERMDKLGVRFMLARTQVETAIAKYERAMDETRTITAGISGR